MCGHKAQYECQHHFKLNHWGHLVPTNILTGRATVTFNLAQMFSLPIPRIPVCTQSLWRFASASGLVYQRLHTGRGDRSFFFTLGPAELRTPSSLPRPPPHPPQTSPKAYPGEALDVYISHNFFLKQDLLTPQWEYMADRLELITLKQFDICDY